MLHKRTSHTVDELAPHIRKKADVIVDELLIALSDVVRTLQERQAEKKRR
jgi:hypothetical protein